MLLSGRWLLCDDGAIRPAIQGAVRAGDGSWRRAEFLVDTGADRTVLSENILSALGLPLVGTSGQLAGVGGKSGFVEVDTVLAFWREDGVPVTFNVRLAGFTDPDALDMSALGRDITNRFAVLVDRQGDVVCLLGQRHQYVIQVV